MLVVGSGVGKPVCDRETRCGVGCRGRGSNRGFQYDSGQYERRLFLARLSKLSSEAVTL